VDGGQVHLLYGAHRERVDRDRVCAGGGQRVGPVAGERPCGHADLCRGLGGRDHVPAGAAAGQADQQVAGPAVGPYLPGEDLLDAVVVADGGERGHVAGQRERGERAPFVLVTADEFRGEVLRLLGAAAVAAGQQAAAGDENLGGPLSPGLQPRYLGLERQ
jgi:hypothetical protein